MREREREQASLYTEHGGAMVSVCVCVSGPRYVPGPWSLGVLGDVAPLRVTTTIFLPGASPGVCVCVCECDVHRARRQ